MLIPKRTCVRCLNGFMYELQRNHVMDFGLMQLIFNFFLRILKSLCQNKSVILMTSEIRIQKYRNFSPLQMLLHCAVEMLLHYCITTNFAAAFKMRVFQLVGREFQMTQSFRTTIDAEETTRSVTPKK